MTINTIEEIKPGDLLILQTRAVLKRKQFRYLKRQAVKAFRHKRIVLLTAGIEVTIARKK